MITKIKLYQNSPEQLAVVLSPSDSLNDIECMKHAVDNLLQHCISNDDIRQGMSSEDCFYAMQLSKMLTPNNFGTISINNFNQE